MGFVIGTAGHIDHGKTALVRILTGQDTDQLKAEKERGISIDLGFAHFDLPDGTHVGVVDVPGHERFIRNMTAGAHGLDLVLFVVAADDGVMPQTEEHFDIVHMLGVENIIFVITKTDKVPEDRFDEVSEEIGILVDGSRFEDSLILPVSNITEDGLEELNSAIGELLANVRPNKPEGWFRMPIDRVFSVHGRGVVVTGTVISGAIRIDEKIAITSTRVGLRVRGLHRHGVEVRSGAAGDRLAINLAGTDHHSLRRGDVACSPRIARAQRWIDAKVSVSPHATTDLKSGQRVRVHLGTSEVFATLKLPKQYSHIARGESGFGQLRLKDASNVMARDHFVIRDEQAEHTLGGGQVLDPVGDRFENSSASWLARLTALAENEPIKATELFVDNLPEAGVLEADMVFRLNIPKDTFIKAVMMSDTLFRVKASSDIWISSEQKTARINQKVFSALSAHHSGEPTSPGKSIEELRNQVARAIDPQLFRAFVELAVDKGDLKHDGLVIAMPFHDPGLSSSQQLRADELLKAFADNPYSPPQPAAEGRDKRLIFTHLETQGELVRAGSGLFFARSAIEAADRALEDHLDDHGNISVADFRDLLGTTRKFALALLESFDRRGRTIRVGDVRKKGKPLE